MKFCQKCGAQLAEESKFCSVCREPVNDNTMENQKNVSSSNFNGQASKGNLLYESKGGQSARKIAMLICGILLIVGGLFCVWIGISEDAQHEFFGGRFKNPGSIMLFGAVIAIFGSFALDFGIGLAQCWVKIYSNCVEAQAFSITGTKKLVQLYYNQISSVQQEGYFVNVISDGKKYKLVCQENARVYELINNSLSRR